MEQKNIQEADKRHEGWMLLLLLVVEGRFCFSVDDGEEAKRQTTSKNNAAAMGFQKKERRKQTATAPSETSFLRALQDGKCSSLARMG